MVSKKELYMKAKAKRDSNCPKALSKMNKAQLMKYLGVAAPMPKKTARRRVAGGKGYFTKKDLGDIKEMGKKKLGKFQRRMIVDYDAKPSGKKRKLKSKKDTLKGL